MARVAKPVPNAAGQKPAAAPKRVAVAKKAAIPKSASAKESAKAVIAEESKPEPAKTRKQRDRHAVPNTFRLGYLLHDVSRMRRTLFDQHMKPEGLTRSQWWVLANLSRKNGSGTMSTELAKQLSVGKVTVGGLIDRLEAAGYVYRRAGKADRRSKLIFITVKGYEVISRMRKITEELNRDIVNGMSLADIEQVEKFLFLMKQNVLTMLDDNLPADDDVTD